MRRSNEKCKVSGYNAGRGITGQALLYQHMSNHYRRILNAKKSIDTAPPATFKTKVNNNSSVACSPVRRYSAVNRKFIGGNISPTLTERTVSTYSNGGSYYKTDAYYGRCHNFLSNACHCRAGLEINPGYSEMELINQIAFDTKRGPANCFDSDWKNVEGRKKFCEFRSPYEAKKIGNRNNRQEMIKNVSGSKSKLASVKRKLPIKDKAPSDLMEKHSKCFIFPNNSFCPRILKTSATSRVKNLKVYHPPRKKRGSSQWKEEEKMKASMNPADLKTKCGVVSSSCPKKKSVTNCMCKRLEASQTSSRDSAYNGGVSSLPESRSPTPDQRTQKTCCCHRKERDTYYDNLRTSKENIVVPNLKLTDNQDTQTEIIANSERKVSLKDDSRNTDYCELISRSKQLNFRDENNGNVKNFTTNDDDKDTFKSKIKEEALYTNFIRDITAEVLEKGLYTNKALKKVMKRHMVSNLWLLDKNRMLKEIDKLRTQLGIPHDEDLLDVKLNATESSLDIDECYPVIPDSELAEPIFDRWKEHKMRRNSFLEDDSLKMRLDNPESDVEKRFPKSISEVLSQSRENNEIVLETESDDEDEELISVIHVSKLIKDKKKRDSFVRDLSSDPSRNATQGNSADESEQSSDHISRKRKSHTRYRKTEKTSSSSEDLEASKRVFESRRHFSGKKDNRGESKDCGKFSTPVNGGNEFKSDSSEREEIESLIE